MFGEGVEWGGMMGEYGWKMILFAGRDVSYRTMDGS